MKLSICHAMREVKMETSAAAAATATRATVLDVPVNDFVE
jgi:hypothetical protein